MAQLVDHLGRPAYYSRGGPGIYESSQDHSLRVVRPDLDKDFATMLSRVKFRAMLSDARWIYTTFSLIRGASRQKSQYVSANGWMPTFVGEDMDYEARCREVHKRLLGRSTNLGWTFSKSWKLACEALDYDGGVFMLHLRDKNGYPLTQFIEAHRVGNRSVTQQVKGGAYDGATMINGIIYSDDGAEIAYNVLGATKEADRQIPAGQMYHVCDNSFFSENRPFPSIAWAILDWYDVKETRGFQKIHNKANSAIALVESNEIGANINSNGAPGGDVTATDGGLRVETLEGGMIRYIRNGGSLTAHHNDAPGDGWRAFDQTIVDGAMYGMGWRSEMMDISKLTGAGVRGFADNINQVIRERHAVISHFAMIDWQFKQAALMERGDLPEHPEWDQFKFPRPARFDTDRGHTSKAELEDVRSGRKSMTELIELDGEDEDVVLRKQAKYLAKKRAIAKEFDLDPSELGTLSLPGDKTAGAPGEKTTEEGEEAAREAAGFESLKVGMDAYGVGVRAGAITPQPEDEENFRAKASWPGISAPARSAWSKDGNVRRPITLVPPGQEGGNRPGAAPASDDPPEE